MTIINTIDCLYFCENKMINNKLYLINLKDFK